MERLSLGHAFGNGGFWNEVAGVLRYIALLTQLIDECEGIQVIRLPPRSPNLNAFAERFVRSIKSECLNRMIFFGHSSLQYAVRHVIAHYHTERNHQGLANRLLQPSFVAALSHHSVQRRQRLGGILNYYYGAAV